MKSVKDIFRAHAVFDANGKHVNGTDKQSNHNYSDSYEALFPNRQNVALVMEVGVADGSSLLAWCEVFPSAWVVGMDIHPAQRAIHAPRIEFHLGDQRSKEDCDRAAAGRQFDFICEDATHRLDDTLRTLLFLWKYVRPGGLYVIEEFDNVGALRDNITALWPNAQLIDTIGPFGGTETMVALRKHVPIKYPPWISGNDYE
jgi:hypothetical protein